MQIERTKCYLCGVPLVRKAKGVEGNRSVDHVPPKGLFPRPLPNDLLTVPCCIRCNGEKSRDDEFFRLIATMGINPPPEAERVFMERTVPNTIAGGRLRREIRDLLATRQRVTMSADGKHEIQDRYHVPLEILERITLRIARGLIAHAFPALGTHRLRFRPSLPTPGEFAETLQLVRHLPLSQISRGGTTFDALYGTTPESSGSAGVCFVVIHGSIGAIVLHDDPDAPVIGD